VAFAFGLPRGLLPAVVVVTRTVHGLSNGGAIGGAAGVHRRRHAFRNAAVR